MSQVQQTISEIAQINYINSIKDLNFAIEEFNQAKDQLNINDNSSIDYYLAKWESLKNSQDNKNQMGQNFLSALGINNA